MNNLDSFFTEFFIIDSIHSDYVLVEDALIFYMVGVKSETNAEQIQTNGFLSSYGLKRHITSQKSRAAKLI